MEDSAKYRIHADVSADGVVERSDVVGAVFGQLEGLLGDALDIHDLQEASKLGRLDVDVDSRGGTSHGHLTVASDLDRAETAILAAALESIDRVGPCRARVEVTDIEDTRATRRETIAERATELLDTAFDEGGMTGDELVEAVRRHVRSGTLTEYEGFPAGPRVEAADAVVVVEGRADVRTLLRAGVKNAVAIGGTDVPDAVADIAAGRTATAFLDGDRGGDLLLRELAQVADLDYVARAPAGRAVEDLEGPEARVALREKVPVDIALSNLDAEQPADTGVGDRSGRQTGAGDAEHVPDALTDGSTTRSDGDESPTGADDDEPDATAGATEQADSGTADPTGQPDSDADDDAAPDDETGSRDDDDAAASDDASTADADAATGDGDAAAGESEPPSMADHVAAVEGEGLVRLLDDEWAVLATADADDAFERVAPDGADTDGVVPLAVVVDGPVTQRLLDAAAQRGVEHVIGAERGEVVKPPVAVRVRTFDDVAGHRNAG